MRVKEEKEQEKMGKGSVRMETKHENQIVGKPTKMLRIQIDDPTDFSKNPHHSHTYSIHNLSILTTYIQIIFVL